MRTAHIKKKKSAKCRQWGADILEWRKFKTTDELILKYESLSELKFEHAKQIFHNNNNNNNNNNVLRN
jgi:hypothetical protein